jgi:mannose-6-phosphate isomerase
MAAQLIAVPNRKEPDVRKAVLYPLRFEPIYQYRLWGGRRLANLLKAPLPANGAFKGRTLTQLLEQFPEQLMGKLAHRFNRFPLLLKFLDAREMLSVQVHPSDAHKELIPPGETGKTEAWVVLEAEKESRIYTSLKPGTTPQDLNRALTNGTVVEQLRCLNPKAGDAVFIPAGTVHTLGGVVVFEVQENSDVTFRARFD